MWNKKEDTPKLYNNPVLVTITYPKYDRAQIKGTIFSERTIVSPTNNIIVCILSL